MKKTRLIFIANLLALTLCACGTPNGAAPVEPASQPTNTAEASEPSSSNDSGAIDNSKTTIGVMTQEYNGDNIAEILMINYDGSQAALETFGGKNPEIETLNSIIKNGIQQTYLEFMGNQGEDSFEWIEIKSYPFTSDDYLQIVTSYIVYPAYGTHGDIESYNFNKKENRYVTVEDAMSEAGLTKESITQKVTELYEPEFPSMSVAEVEPAGFLIRQGEAGPYTIFLLEVVIDNSEAEPWKGLFAFVPQSSELYELGENCLFDPYDMDEMNPPLSYMRVAAPAGAEEIGQGIYYAELITPEGDPGDGLTPREGADLVVTDLLAPMGFFDTVNFTEHCVYISFDDLLFLDSAKGHECYIYSVAIGTPEGGLMGDGYEVVSRAGVDYGEKTVFLYEE